MSYFSTEEAAIVLYHASREIRHKTVGELLKHKCPISVRNEKSISDQCIKQRKACEKAGLGQMRGTKDKVGSTQSLWDRKVVDMWLVRSMEKGKLEKLLEFDGMTAAIIEQASTVKLHSCFWHTDNCCGRTMTLTNS